MFMKHTGIIDGLGRTVIVEESQATFDAIYAPRGWVTATQTEADTYFGAPNPDDTLVTKAQLDAALAGSGGSFVASVSAVADGTTDVASTIQAALTAAGAAGGGRVILPAKPLPYMIGSTLLMPSGVTLDATGATVKLIAGAKTYMLGAAGAPPGNAAGAGTRTTGLSVIGGTWNTDYANNNANAGATAMAGWVGHCFDFRKVDRLLIRDVLIQNAWKWSIAAADCSDVTATRLRFDTRSDGIHLIGPISGAKITDVRGVCGDDMVGLSNIEWPAYAVSEGSMSNIVIRDVELLPGCTNGVRVLGGIGYNIDGLTIQGVRGIVTTGTSYGVYIYNNQQDSTKDGTDIRGLIVRDIDITVPDGRPVVSVGVSRLRDAVIENISTSGTYTDVPVVAVGGAPTGATFTCDDLVIRNVRLLSGRSVAVVSLTGGGSPVFKRVVIDGVHAPDTTVTGSFGVRVYSGATISELNINDVKVESGSATLVGLGSAVAKMRLTNLRHMNTASTGVTGLSIDTVTVTDCLVDDAQVNCLSGGFVVYLGNGAAFTKLVARNVKMRNASGASNNAIRLTSGTSITDLAVTDLDVLGTGQSCNGILIDGTVGHGSLRGGRASGVNAVVNINATTAGSSPYWHLSQVFATNFNAMLKAKSNTEADISDSVSDGPLQGTVALFTTTSTPVRLKGTGVKQVSGSGLSKDGSQVVSLGSPTFGVDVSLLAKNLGDQAYNTNGALACGVGPVVCYSTGTPGWRSQRDATLVY